MDGLTSNSPWLPFVYGIGMIEQLTRISPQSLIILTFVVAYYAFLGSSLDLLLNAIVVSIKKRLIITAAVACSWTVVRTTLSPVFSAIVVSSLLLSCLNSKPSFWTGPARPYLIPCRTMHTRLFPQKHAFGYSYLVVGVPIGSSGTFNGLLTIEGRQSDGIRGMLSKVYRDGWYSVNPWDYLQRGSDNLNLRGKLDAYLISQGVSPSDYPHAYLITAARFLGYHFNPVSFWYLYSHDRVLSAIVVEVNNTFDERRPYLVLRDFSAEQRLLDGPIPDVSPVSRIKSSWGKDFHVSPFNSIKGSYTLMANDPLGPGMQNFRGVDVTINLNSSKGHAKLITRLFSQGRAIDPDSLTFLEKTKFLFTWCWVGLATFPRIVKEAGVLFFRKNLHVWYRPEPLKDSLGRHATGTERDLEIAFRQYLRFLVGQCSKPFAIKYSSSGITSSTEEMMRSPACERQVKDLKVLHFKVLTPAFYSRFVHYAHDFEAVFTELADNGTIWVDEPQYLQYVFLKRPSTPLHSTSVTDYVFFKAIQTLRRRPPKIIRVSKSVDSPTSVPDVVDIREFRISSMDAYILKHADRALKLSYRSALLRLFSANRFLKGSEFILDFAIWLSHPAAAWLLVRALSQVLENP